MIDYGFCGPPRINTFRSANHGIIGKRLGSEQRIPQTRQRATILELKRMFFEMLLLYLLILDINGLWFQFHQFRRG